MKLAIVLSFLPPNTRSSHLNLIQSFIQASYNGFKEFSCLVLISNDNDFLIKYNKFILLRKEQLNYAKDLNNALNSSFSSDLSSKVNVKVAINNGDLSLNLIEINQFCPNVLLYWGGIFESKQLRHLTYPNYPIIFNFFNYNNLLDKQADLYLSTQKDHILRGEYDPKLVSYQPIATTFMKPRKFSYAWKDVKNSANEITLITAFGGNRLAGILNNYSKNRLNAFFAILEKYPLVRWVFMGVENADKIFAIDPRFNVYKNRDQFEVKSREKYLRAFYDHCNLYVHLPNMSGGAGGVTMAREQNLAVLCYKNSDACNVQHPKAIYHNDNDFFNAINFYVEHPEARIALGKELKTYLLDNFSPEAVAKQLRENILLAIENYNKRISNKNDEIN